MTAAAVTAAAVAGAAVVDAPAAPAAARQPRSLRLMGCCVRWLLWRCTLVVTGGLTVTGRLPRGGCVVVANHTSHADTPALLAALGLRRVAVAAAADYWFATPRRAGVCRWLVGGFAVRRGGGGAGDLFGEALPLLRSGGVVVVFPAGTRARSGEPTRWHGGALRLAAEAGVPVVPVGVAGTARLLPVHGAPRPAPVRVRIGRPIVTPSVEVARAAVLDLANGAVEPTDSRLRQRLATVACSRRGVLLVAVWALAEAVSWPFVPELAVGVLVLATPRAVLRLVPAALVGSVLGGVLCFSFAAAGSPAPQPLTTPRMHAAVAEQVDLEGAAALRHQPLSGIPYKVYAAEAGRAGVPVATFVAESVVARGLRLGIVCGGLAAAAGVTRRTRRFVPIVVPLALGGFAVGLARVFHSWS